MDKILPVIIFAVGVFLVVKGGDLFVDAAGRIARAANIPSFIIGATIVSLATTMPEMIVSVMASLDGKNDMAVGNAVGSVTANTGLIMAIAFIFMAVSAPRKKYCKQYILLLSATAVLWAGSISGRLSVYAGFVLLIIFILFMILNITQARAAGQSQSTNKMSRKELSKNILFFLLGAFGIVLGSNLLIDGGSSIAVSIGVPERVIAVTMVAIGTSLPELVTTITAIRKKQAHLSVGNIIGANIIDLSLILLVCAFLSGGSFPVSRQSLAIDFPACMLVTLMAIIPLMVKQRSYKAQGFIMLAAYIGYVFITM